MSAAHQQFSARTRQSGELDKRAGKRRRSLKDGRISVTLGADLGCVVEVDASADNRSAGNFIRKLVLAHYAAQGQDDAALAARAAALRAASEAEQAAS